MSKKIFEYWCHNCEQIFEAMAHNNLETKYCDFCGMPGKVTISPVRFRLDGTDPSFPTEWDRWAKRHEEKAKQEERKIAEDSEDS